MKKFRIIGAFALVLVMLMSTVSFAAYDTADYPFFSDGVGQIIAKNNTPTIDGTASESEGYSVVKELNSTNMAPFWSPQSMCIIKANVYFAWDAKNLYLAADITDPSMMLSKAEDDSEGKNDYGYDGDMFVFMLDPLGECFNSGMTQTNNRTAWYCFGIGEGNMLKSYRTQVNEADLSTDVSGVATTTTNGWAFEVSIPWATIVDDTFSASSGDVDLKVEDITTAGAISKAGVMYLDRAVANEEFAQFNQGSGAVAEGKTFTISRNITIPKTLPDGTDGVQNGGESVRSYGIDLTIGDADGVAPITEKVETTKAETTAKETKAKSTTKAEETQKEEKKEEKSGGLGVGAIIGIVLGVLVVAGVIVFFVMKNKKKGNNGYVGGGFDNVTPAAPTPAPEAEEEAEEEEEEVDWNDLTPEQQKEYLDSLSPEEREEFEKQLKDLEEE